MLRWVTCNDLATLKGSPPRCRRQWAVLRWTVSFPSQSPPSTNTPTVLQGSGGHLQWTSRCLRLHKQLGWGRKPCWLSVMLLRKTEQPWGQHLLQIISETPPAILKAFPTNANRHRLAWTAMQTQPLSNGVLFKSADQRARQRNMGIVTKNLPRLFTTMLAKAVWKTSFQTNP